MLKNVGALTQTLSLVSTAMGLASCGLDSNDIEDSPRILGIDWRIESTVGVSRSATGPRTRHGPATRIPAGR